MKKKETAKTILLKKIIKHWPNLNIMEIAAPQGFGISGRNRLNELRHSYFGFEYEYVHPKGTNPGHYDFGDMSKKELKEILKKEQTNDTIR